MDLVGAVLKETLPGDNCGKSYRLVRRRPGASINLKCECSLTAVFFLSSMTQEQHLASVAGAYGADDATFAARPGRESIRRARFPF